MWFTPHEIQATAKQEQAQLVIDSLLISQLNLRRTQLARPTAVHTKRVQRRRVEPPGGNTSNPVSVVGNIELVHKPAGWRHDMPEWRCEGVLTGSDNN